ncbi:MAG: ABC transporter ATP-binding protein [Desulfosarcinaceae bacterium]|jgi:oligopeptide/dipeptide ABC transporter ATP-binding protein
MPSPNPLLRVEKITKVYKTGYWKKRTCVALDNVSFELEAGRTLAVVGESGSGKSTLCRAALGLTPLTSGRVVFEGRNLAGLNGDLKVFRRRTQMVFQDADGALNPRMIVRQLLLEPARIHKLPLADPDQWTTALLKQVNLTSDLLCRHPHELSGGQRQRLSLARAVSLSPRLIAADEPIASLDRSAQAEALVLMKEIQASTNTAILYVTHDLRTLKYLAHYVAVMYLGAFVEYGPLEEILGRPLHPYTRAMLASAGLGDGQNPHAVFLTTDPCSSFNIPSGCRFHPRCPDAVGICSRQKPSLIAVSGQRSVACLALETSATPTIA